MIDGGLVIVWEVLSNFVAGLELALRLHAALTGEILKQIEKYGQ